MTAFKIISYAAFTPEQNESNAPNIIEFTFEQKELNNMPNIPRKNKTLKIFT